MWRANCPSCGQRACAACPISSHEMLRCCNCALVFAADRAVPMDTYEHAYSECGEYGDAVRMAEALKSAPRSYRWDLEWVLDHVPTFGSSRMLDLGCGVGAAMLRAADRGWKVHGQDVSLDACQAIEDVLGLPAYCGTLKDLVKEGKQFELITAFHLLEHLPDPLTFTRLARRLVVDGGYIGIAVPNYDSYTVRHTTNAQWLPPFHINYFTNRSLSHLLSSCSFRLESSRVRLISWGGIEGPKSKRYALLPYLIANRLIGRLQGNIVALVARAC